MSSTQIREFGQEKSTKLILPSHQKKRKKYNRQPLKHDTRLHHFIAMFFIKGAAQKKSAKPYAKRKNSSDEARDKGVKYNCMHVFVLPYIFGKRSSP